MIDNMKVKYVSLVMLSLCSMIAMIVLGSYPIYNIIVNVIGEDISPGISIIMSACLFLLFFIPFLQGCYYENIIRHSSKEGKQDE